VWPPASVTDTSTVLLFSPVPMMTGTEFDVRLSVVDVPVSLAASCFRPMAATGAVWSSVNAPVPAVETLPAASVAITLSVTAPSTRPLAGRVPEVGVAVAMFSDQLPLASVVAVYVMAPPDDGVTVTVTVLLASAVPARIGFWFLVRLSVAEVPVSSAASCFRLIVGAPMVWSSTNEPVAVVVLPAASVETTFSDTVPSGRPAAGIVPEVGVAVAVLTDQAPVASVVAL